MTEEQKKTQGQETRDKILDVAVDLFSKKGFNAVSIRDITREVGIKESSLYNHFKSKDDILDTIFAFFEANFAKAVPTYEMLEPYIDKHGPYELLRAGVTKFKLVMEDETLIKIYRVLVSEQYHYQKARNILYKDSFEVPIELMERVFAKFLKEGWIRPFDPIKLANSYQMAINSFLHEYDLLKFLGKDRAKVQDKVFDFIKTFWELIKA